MSKLIASALILLCVLVSVATAQIPSRGRFVYSGSTTTDSSAVFSLATAQTPAQTPAGSFAEDQYWQLEAVKYEGDKWTHWNFQPDERRFRFSDHEWVEGEEADYWFSTNWGARRLKERICKDCLRWEVLRWKSHRSSLELGVTGFEELVARIKRKKARE